MFNLPCNCLTHLFSKIGLVGISLRYFIYKCMFFIIFPACCLHETIFSKYLYMYFSINKLHFAPKVQNDNICASKMVCWLVFLKELKTLFDFLKFLSIKYLIYGTFPDHYSLPEVFQS